LPDKREAISRKELTPVAKIIPISEHFQHFLAEMKESFWGDLYGQTKLAWQRFFELESERQRDRFSGCGRYVRAQNQRRVYRNGYYERDFVTRFGTLRLRIARTREKSFLPWRSRTISAAGGRGIAVDSGSVLARHQHSASGAGGGYADRRSSERADGIEADAGFG
jgi:Transposase, Mutator family